MSGLRLVLPLAVTKIAMSCNASSNSCLRKPRRAGGGLNKKSDEYGRALLSPLGVIHI
jgi:hypothetical protein